VQPSFGVSRPTCQWCAFVRIDDYVASFHSRFPFLDPSIPPWQVTAQLSGVLEQLATLLSSSSFRNFDGVLVHDTATIEAGAVVKAPAIISDGCFIASTAYVRGGVFLDRGVVIGPGCEVKTAVIMANSTLAHFNFVGDSIIGADVNIEAGAVVANHFNERSDKEVSIYVRGERIRSGTNKFGAVIGDHCRVGANAVLSPGTVLEPSAVVGRLALVDQALTSLRPNERPS
jgi:UDP-N-acetylglucosamine diphosphorylase / glucose-1-phosphate thymidylyltransferase / UDP-N-acetylgalactosamine diphosphorylase / glucosamine-1-phosphate N-acetyltransferase / galactosamine-1-phosphate N-acetyltransferase